MTVIKSWEEFSLTGNTACIQQAAIKAFISGNYSQEEILSDIDGNNPAPVHVHVSCSFASEYTKIPDQT